MFKKSWLGAAAIAATALPLSAQALTPVSYVFDQPTACGTFCYDDSTGRELIDGATGYAGWGVGGAGPWVGWVYQPTVNIDFDFGQQVQVTGLRIGSTQDSVGDVVLPSISLSAWTGSTWVPVASLAVPESAANDRYWLSNAAHTWLDLGSLNVQARKLRVTASFSNDGPWTFIDEVQFNAAPVPEPGTWGLMALGTALLWRRMRVRAG